jgi:hypothetical protein
MRRALISTALAALLLTGGIMPAGAWDRGDTEIFAVLPDLPGGPVQSEGLTVGPDGTVYTPSFGINKPNGQLLYDVALVNPGSPQPSTLLLGLVFQKSSHC